MVTSSCKGGDRNRISSASPSFLRHFRVRAFCYISTNQHLETLRTLQLCPPIASIMPKASKGQYSPRVPSDLHAP